MRKLLAIMPIFLGACAAQPLVMPPIAPIERLPQDQVTRQIVTYEQAFEASISPVPVALEFQQVLLEPYIEDLDIAVRALVLEAVAAAESTGPLGEGRSQRLVDELQYRLDPLADGARRDRDHRCRSPDERRDQIDYYWIVFYNDRTCLFIKPMCDTHVLAYTIMHD